MNVSLTKFCRDFDLPKTTVYRRIQELNLDVSSGLDIETIVILKNEFGIIEPQPEPLPESPVIDVELVPEGFIQGGQLATVETREIELPQGFDPSAMVRFFDGVTGQATDTGKLLAIADMALGSVETAMNTKLEEQRKQLEQAEKDAKALTERVNQTKVTLQVKALESRILAEKQTSATKTAEQLFQELMTMGKPESSSAA